MPVDAVKPLLLLELHRVSVPRGHAVHLSHDAGDRPITACGSSIGLSMRVADLSWLEELPGGVLDLLGGLRLRLLRGYDVDADRGVVQVADHYELSGKKAWTWGPRTSPSSVRRT